MLLATIDGDRPIGVSSLDHIDAVHRKAEFGISLEKGSWGQGYGSEATRLMVDYAFITLNLHRVYLRVFEFNERAIRCYLKAGFQKEGLLRQEHYTEGRYWDALIMSVLRPEWEARKEIPASETIRPA
jgi:RimJ/RimL family protein N-acetyltransferase